MIGLATERLVLRPVEPGDTEALLSVRNHPDAVGATALGTAMTAEHMERQLHRWLDLWRARAVGSWLIEQGGDVVGYVAVDPIGEGYPGDDPEDLEIGVVIIADRWGQGIAREAGSAVVHDSLTRGGLKRVYATVETTNARSIAVLTGAPGVRLIGDAEGERLYELTLPEDQDVG